MITFFEKFTFGDETKDVRVVVIGFTTKVNEENITISVSEEHEDYKWCSWDSLNEIELSKPSKAIITKILGKG
jgi:hypothetical protein